MEILNDVNAKNAQYGDLLHEKSWEKPNSIFKKFNEMFGINI